MREFTDETGRAWVATAHEENTPRHHGRWYLVFHPRDEQETLLAMPEVRWQTRATAERTLSTMSLFELCRRLNVMRARAASTGEPGMPDVDPPAARERTSASAG
jgi:hypothetical protein